MLLSIQSGSMNSAQKVAKLEFKSGKTVSIAITAEDYKEFRRFLSMIEDCVEEVVSCLDDTFLDD